MLGIPYGYDCAFGKPLASNILPDLIHENRSAQVALPMRKVIVSFRVIYLRCVKDEVSYLVS